jgi:hypothetical protein
MIDGIPGAPHYRFAELAGWPARPGSESCVLGSEFAAAERRGCGLAGQGPEFCVLSSEFAAAERRGYGLRVGPHRHQRYTSQP